MSDSQTTLERLRQLGSPDPSLCAPQDDPESEEASDRAGLVGKTPPVGVILEWPDGNSETVLYASLVSPIHFDPSIGIRFVFEGRRLTEEGRWEMGQWLVTVQGNNLQPIRNHLSSGRRESVRVNRYTVTAILVERLPP